MPTGPRTHAHAQTASAAALTFIRLELASNPSISNRSQGAAAMVRRSAAMLAAAAAFLGRAGAGAVLAVRAIIMLVDLVPHVLLNVFLSFFS